MTYKSITAADLEVGVSSSGGNVVHQGENAISIEILEQQEIQTTRCNWQYVRDEIV